MIPKQALVPLAAAVRRAIARRAPCACPLAAERVSAVRRAAAAADLFSAKTVGRTLVCRQRAQKAGQELIGTELARILMKLFFQYY